MASALSGRAGRLAAMWGVDQAQNTANRISDLLQVGQDNSLGAIGEGKTAAIGALDQFYGAARPQFDSAIARLDPWVDAGRSALSMYTDSAGLGGAAGNDNATAAFRASPGYRNMVDEATDAVARQQSAIGMLGSGNTAQAITDRASNLADRQYGQWQDRIQGISRDGMSAANTQAGIDQSIGNLIAQQGRDTAGIHTGAANAEAGIFGNFAGMNAGNIANLGQQTIDLGTAGLMAGQQAAQNRLGLGMNIAGLLSGIAGRALGAKAA